MTTEQDPTEAVGGQPGSIEPGSDATEPPCLRRAVRSALSMVIGPPLLAGAASFFADLSAGAIARALCFVVAWFAVLYVSRLITHAELGYLKWTTPLHRVLCGVLVVELLIALAFVVSVPLVFFSDARPQDVAVLQFWLSIGLALAVLVHSLVLSWLVERLRLPRGTEHADNCGVVGVLYDAGERLGLGWLVRHFRHATAPNHVSALVIWTLMALVGVTVIDLPAAAPGIAHVLTRGEAEEPDGSVAVTVESKTPPDKSPTPPAPARPKSAVELPVAEEPVPRYDALCPDAAPGRGAPGAQRKLLFLLWLGPSGLGAIFGGCANEAHRVRPGVYAAAGTCFGKLRSVAIATAEGDAAILLWEPANFALKRVKDGTLLGATPHRYAGGGDLYSVTTVLGTYVFARTSVSDGFARMDGTPRSCDDVHEDPVPFVRVPPALVRLWVDLMERRGRWYWPVVDGKASRIRFESTDPADMNTVTASCTSDTACTLLADGVESRTSGREPVRPSRLFAYAPAAPTRRR
ncbi:MAG TPA: hypothetical protein VN238_17360 [Solirubrobacteraceae bacterium]|nr:hypothetical protein [Solirubrobacteraceae bacterium]